jgi:pimeloyl-ACP methyl ester carboxylesterase
MLPDIDLDDVVVQEALREFVVPTELLDEFRRLGLATRKAASRSSVPTLVIQGVRDGLVQPKDSEALARALPDARMELVDGSHNLLSPTDGAWHRIRGRVMEFLGPAS